jgi:hypothetical protein
MLRRLRDAREKGRERWEGLCRRCGLCCYEKEVVGVRVVKNDRRPCLHLDTETRRCTVYETRFDVCAQCRKMTVFHALFVRWLPDDCGYVRHFRRLGRAPGRARPRRPAESEAP